VGGSLFWAGCHVNTNVPAVCWLTQLQTAPPPKPHAPPPSPPFLCTFAGAWSNDGWGGVGSFFWSYICFLASWHWHKLPRSAENFCKFYFIAFSQVESRVDVSLHIYTDIKPWNVCVYVCVLAIRAKQIASFVVLLYQYLTFGLVFCLLPKFFFAYEITEEKTHTAFSWEI